MKLSSALAIFALAATLAAPAGAESFTSDGVATGQSKSETVEFSADHRIVTARTEYSKFEMADPTNPMNRLKGDCFGVMEVRGGAVEGEGFCILDGLEGDRVLLGWDARRIDPKGRVHGYWTVNSGTGLWLQASGGGTFMTTTNPANGAATNTIRGAITLR